MRSVKSKGNRSTEIKIIDLFRKNSVKGWRRNYPLFGKPDFVFPKSKLTLFIDGCFWHGHDCRNVKPKQNKSYWKSKIERNMSRDKLVKKQLTKKGWKVIRIWECELKEQGIKVIKKVLNKLWQVPLF